MSKRISSASQWRDQLLIQLRIVYYPLLLCAGIVVVFGARTPTMRWFGIGLLVMTAVLLGILNLRAISYASRVWSLIACFVLISAGSYVLCGATPGSVLTSAFSLVLAALLVGRTAAMSLLALYTAFILLLTALVHFQWWSGPSPLELDPSNSQVWLRMSLISATVWACISLPVLFLVDNVESGLKRSQTDLENLRAEQARRLAAVHARQEAEHLAAQSQKLESLGRLAAGVAHDFNNALVVIRGWNAIRDESADALDHRQAFQAIEEATAQASHLASQLLTFGRREKRSPRRLSLDQVVESTAETLKRLLPAGIELKLDLAPQSWVFADPSQLQQTLVNLVLNARDALPGGGFITIRVRNLKAPPGTIAASPDSPWVLLEIGDNGTGMSPAVRETAFEPFFTSKPVGSGSGLGLSSVLGIVKQSDGFIDLNSTEGEGTLVSIFLPASEAGNGERPMPVSHPAVDVKGARVMVVEDDMLARKLIVRSLETAGFCVFSAQDGSEAIRVIGAQTAPFDVLCSDAVFPGDSLEAVIQAFQKHSPEARILLCSGYVPEELKVEGHAADEFPFLAKPFKPRQLVERVSELLS